FSPQSPMGVEYHNVTSFIGRPEEPLVRALLRADSALLNVVGRAFPSLLRRNPHRLRTDD
ncbi:MAG TPA: 2OG-Fe(II) oxygenase, partial [Thermoanaerobaculia bacterium]|nr:2OG-Fe(II) oxygenase [Thermoanaerobaculia bacterium]